MRGFLLTWAIWILLALPGAGLLAGYFGGGIDAMDMLHPTGEFAVRFMVLAMMIGPLHDLFGSRGWTRWLLARRRWLGFAAFLYAIGHLVFYVIDMGALADILGEIAEHGIWTGWLAMLLMAAPGLTSTDAAMRSLRGTWKRMQRLAYPAALFTALHWILLEWQWIPAAVHFGPLVVLNLARAARRLSRPRKESVA
jgi:sulfoxide reductase heme-binding subunit YedZ